MTDEKTIDQPGSLSTSREMGNVADSSPADRGEEMPYEALLDWIEHHQTTALLGAFAVGVFIGVMMRR